jgi:hypothetical protein
VLSGANRSALAHVRSRAEAGREQHLARIARVLSGAGVPAEPEALLRAAGERGVVTLNFHPDRLLGDGRTVAAALLAEGVYRSQFETGISSGGLTAYPGGDRGGWEHAMFGGAYDGAPAAERPKYGGLTSSTTATAPARPSAPAICGCGAPRAAGRR